MRGICLGQERSAALVHLVPTGHPARHGAGGAGSGQFATSDLFPLPGTSYAGSGAGVV